MSTETRIFVPHWHLHVLHKRTVNKTKHLLHRQIIPRPSENQILCRGGVVEWKPMRCYLQLACQFLSLPCGAASREDWNMWAWNHILSLHWTFFLVSIKVAHEIYEEEREREMVMLMTLTRHIVRMQQGTWRHDGELIHCHEWWRAHTQTHDQGESEIDLVCR